MSLSRTIKIISFVVLGIILLFAALFFTATQFVDPNSFKPKITQFVKNKTGRTITIGTIKWSFFPTAGLEIQHLTLSNPPGADFKTPFFAEVDKAAVSVSVLPLLFKKLNISTIHFEGAHVWLIRNKKSQTTWSGLIPEKVPQKISGVQLKNTPVSGSLSSFQLSTSAISFNNAQVVWWDQTTTNQPIYLKNLELHSTTIKHNKPFTVTISAELSQKGAKFSAQSQFSALVNLDLNKQAYQLQNTRLKLLIMPVAENTSSTIKKLPISANADIAVDGKAQTITADNLSVTIADLVGKGRLQGSNINNDNIKLSGTFECLPFNPKEMLALLGWDIKLKNPNSLGKAKGHFNFTATNSELSLSQLKLEIDNTPIDGDMAIQWADNANFMFNLHINKLAVDDYTPAPVAASSATLKAISTEKAVAAGTMQNSAFSPLKKLILTKSSLKIDALSIGKLDLTQCSANVEGKKGMIQVAPIDMQLYDGKASGGLTLNVQGPTPKYTFNLHLKGVNVEKLLLANTGNALVKGTLAMDTNLTMKGQSKDQLIQTLGGKGRFNVTSGSINVLDAGQILSLATAIINKQPKPVEKTNVQQTTFDTLTGNFLIKGGHFNNYNLQLSSPTISTTGKGTVNLDNKKLNYLLKITGVKSISSVDGKEKVTLYNWFVPVSVVGTLDKPIVRPSYEDISKQVIKHQIKKQLFKKLDEKTQKAVGGVIDTLFP